MPRYLATGLLLLSAGIVNAGAPQENAPQHCTDPRPEACTMDYRPVCATLGDGSEKTYSNGCSACSDPQVGHYREGECGGKPGM